MKKRSDHPDSGYDIGDLLGLGQQSVRKNYYPALQDRIEELEQERNRYKWLFENALHGIFQANLRGGFLACNSAMARLCGYDSPEHLLAGVVRLREQLFCRSAEFDTIRQELLDYGSLSARETTLLRADYTPVHVAITLLRRPDLGPEIVEAFVADITERVQAREKLEQLNAELEQRVEERTEALQSANTDLHYQIEEREKVEQELVVAVDAAKEANRSKDKYLAAASHDLLQPLNAARLMVSALQDSRLPDKQDRMVQQAHRALEGAEELLTDLLDISKLDQQAMNPDFAYVNIQDMVLGLGEEFSAMAAGKGLDFRIRSCPAVVPTDQRMLVRIIRNLLSNALRYTNAGGIVLALRKRTSHLVIEVWDTGIGIERYKLKDIFTEFHQLLPQGTGGRQGVGLGLAIVERMVRILGYRIDVSSRPGQGSRFRIGIPLDQAVTEQQSVPEPVPSVMVDDLDGTIVMVVENEAVVLESMVALLEQWHCVVLAVGSAEEAITLLDDGLDPDIILADYHLDLNRTGLDAIAAIRKHAARDIPAAIITADRSDDIRGLIRARSLPLLNKPVKPNRLRALLGSLHSET